MYGEHGQLRAWALESRIRYGLVWGGLNALVVIGLVFAFGDLSVSLALMAVSISVLAQGLIWYPVAKRKVTRQHTAT